MVCSVVSLLANIALIGGAKQLSEKIVLTWIVWKYLLILLWWAWYGYNMLKYHGYIDWTAQGMRQCYWCHQRDVQEMMGYIDAIASFVPKSSSRGVGSEEPGAVVYFAGAAFRALAGR